MRTKACAQCALPCVDLCNNVRVVMGNVLQRRSAQADPDSAWKQQNKEQKENPVYLYINLQKTGKLVEVYERGEDALRTFVRDELEPLFYNQGKGKVIRKIDYIRWKNKCTDKLLSRTTVDVRSDSQVLQDFKEDTFNKFEEHEACWSLDQRGSVGETPLNLSILVDTPSHRNIAKILLELYPKLALDFYEGDEYYGESSLHIAIVYGDLEMVKLLVQNGANVNQRATGRFFLPEDQKRGTPNVKLTNYEGYAYYGEFPLAFAASFGHEEIYDYLIDHGANPNFQDSFGNTVLHMLVITNQISMYGYAVKHHVLKADLEIANYAALTPLTLASKLGRNEIFKEIIELQSIEIWRYSNITCSKYPLAPLDTIGQGGKTNLSSALIYITNGDTMEHLEMLEGGVIKQLLDEKWNKFAKRRFFERLILAILHLVVLSIAIYTRPDTEPVSHTDPISIVRYVSEIIVCCACLTNLIFQLIEIRSQGCLGFIKNQASAPGKFIFNISCILILLCIPMRIAGLDSWEVILLAAAAPCAWAYLLFFARGAHLSGAFVTIVYQMLRGDLYSFAIIYTCFLLGFVPGFYFLFKDIENENIKTFETIEGTVMQLFQMTLGEFKYEDFDETRIPLLTKAVFVVFAILVPILLLNMLIAMMGNTYQQIINRSEKEWRRQWAKIIVVLERTYSRQQLLKFQEEYSVSFGTGPTADDRGLMVIKTSRKTKARQRKGAISNWKRLVHEIKTLIKEQKLQGKSGPLDLTSDEVYERVHERQFLKRQSNLLRQTRSFRGEPEADFTDGGGNADDLMTAMTQLAWQQDIDLTKGKVFSESTDSKNTKNADVPLTSPVTSKSNESDLAPLLKNKSKTDTSESENLGSSDTRRNNPGTSKPESVAKTTKDVKSSMPLLKTSKVAPAEEPQKSQKGPLKSSKGQGRTNLINPETDKSKDKSASEAGVDDKSRQVKETGAIMADDKSSFNSSTSLTSLLQGCTKDDNRSKTSTTEF